MPEIIDLSARRKPVTYTVTITHHWDDTLDVFVADVADDERSRAAVADALMRAAKQFGALDVFDLQPIESVPRDGSSVLVVLAEGAVDIWTDYRRCEGVCIAQFEADGFMIDGAPEWFFDGHSDDFIKGARWCPLPPRSG